MSEITDLVYCEDPLPDELLSMDMPDIDYTKQAGQLTSAITRISDLILNKCAEMDQQGRADECLFIMVGEGHFFCAHPIVHMEVLKNISNKETKVVAGYEFSHNHKNADASGHPHGDVAASLQECSDEISTYAFVSQHCLRDEFCRLYADKKLNIIFNDAAMDYVTEGNKLTGDMTLSPHDEYVQLAYDAYYKLEKCKQLKVDDILAHGDPVVSIRNHVLYNKMVGFTQEFNPRIAYQHAGAGHLLHRESDTKNHGLPALYQRAGYAVLSIDFREEGLPTIVATEDEDRAEGIISTPQELIYLNSLMKEVKRNLTPKL
jgi:hypothetical protein